jgi:hypothetical protein
VVVVVERLEIDILGVPKSVIVQSNAQNAVGRFSDPYVIGPSCGSSKSNRETECLPAAMSLSSRFAKPGNPHRLYLKEVLLFREPRDEVLERTRRNRG